jgi:hypothetical protein
MLIPARAMQRDERKPSVEQRNPVTPGHRPPEPLSDATSKDTFQIVEYERSDLARAARVLARRSSASARTRTFGGGWPQEACLQ